MMDHMEQKKKKIYILQKKGKNVSISGKKETI